MNLRPSGYEPRAFKLNGVDQSAWSRFVLVADGPRDAESGFDRPFRNSPFDTRLTPADYEGVESTATLNIKVGTSRPRFTSGPGPLRRHGIGTGRPNVEP